MSKATQIASFIAAVAVMAAWMAIGVPGAMAAEDEEAGPQTFVSLKFEGACDERNNRLWLTNTHTFKTIAATLRWHADGGKDLTEQFYAGPNSVREIGCASDAEIVEASFAQF